MARPKLRFLFAFLIVSAIFFSGWLFVNRLPPTTPTEQVRKADWKQEGNVYTTEVAYESPGGEEANTFTIVLDKGVIKDVGVGITTNIDESIRYQKIFAAELPKIIVGRRLADLEQIDRVAGASLTTTAFNEAVSALKNQVLK